MRSLCALVVMLLLAGAAQAQTADAPPPAVAAKISDFAWLAGSWAGEGFGGQMEEVWSAPNDTSMVGYFRLSQKGKPTFYEIMTLLEHNGSVEMRLKHVNPDMTGWEEKAVYQTFKLEKLDATGAYFDGLRLKRVDANTIDGTFIVRRSGKVSEEKFVYKRAALP